MSPLPGCGGSPSLQQDWAAVGGAYQRLRDLTRDNVLDELHPSLRPDIVAVLDENAELRGKLAATNGALHGSRDVRARVEKERDELRDRLAKLEKAALTALDHLAGAGTAALLLGELRELLNKGEV